MNWVNLVLMMSSDADNSDYITSDSIYDDFYDRDELEVGKPIRYTDPSGTLPTVNVVTLTPQILELQVGDNVCRITNDSWTKLGEGGRDYTRFSLDARLDMEPKDKQITCLACNCLSLLKMRKSKIARLELADDAESKFIVGPRDNQSSCASGWLIAKADGKTVCEKLVKQTDMAYKAILLPLSEGETVPEGTVMKQIRYFMMD